MRQKILKTGNSLAVTIPAQAVQVLGLRSGQLVEVKSDLSKGLITLLFTSSGQLNLLAKK